MWIVAPSWREQAYGLRFIGKSALPVTPGMLPSETSPYSIDMAPDTAGCEMPARRLQMIVEHE